MSRTPAAVSRSACIRTALLALSLGAALGAASSATAGAPVPPSSAPPPQVVMAPPPPLVRAERPSKPSRPVAVIDNPSPEAEALGARFTQLIVEGFDFKALWNQSMGQAQGAIDKSMASQTDPRLRKLYDRFGPWVGVFRDAAWEEFEHDRPALNGVVGHFFAQRMTSEELRGVVALLEGPYGKEYAAYIADQAMSRPKIRLSAGAQKASDRFANTSAGRGFTDKMTRIADDEAAMEPLMMDLAAELTPGLVRRWGEKAEAAEEARKAAAGH